MTLDDLENGISIDGNVIKLSDNLLGTSKVSVKEKDYILALSDDVATPETAEPSWSIKGTTATLQSVVTTDGYACDGTSINYIKKGATEKIITLSGLKSGLKTSTNGNIDGISVDDVNKTITLSDRVLNKTTVKVTGDYKLDLDADVTDVASVDKPIWSLNKTTATLTQAQLTGYIFSDDQKTLNYSKKASTATLATLTGVNSVDDMEIIEKDGNQIIKLSKNALGTGNVTVTKGNYMLEVDESLTESKNAPAWNVNGTTAIYKNTRSAYYTPNGKSVTYHKQEAITGEESIITLNGLVKNLAVTGDGDIDGILIDDVEKTVTLSANVLNKTAVKIIGDYRLELDGDVKESEVGDVGFELKNTTVTFKQKTSTGYVLSNDGKSITYSKKDTVTNPATINGVNKSTANDSNITFDETNKVVNLSANALSNKVTVGGSTAFDFGDDYNDATIIGSKSADTITVAGKGLSITGGKDNDIIDLGTAGGNTFFYASGDGNDVIANFTTGDRLKINSCKIVSVDESGDDVIVNVGTVSKGKNKITGTITLENAAYWFEDGNNFSVTDSELTMLSTGKVDYSLDELDTSTDALQPTQDKSQLFLAKK